MRLLKLGLVWEKCWQIFQYFSWFEVVKQEKVLDTLKDSSDDLKIGIVNLEQDICLLEFHLAEKLKVLNFIKVILHYLFYVAFAIIRRGLDLMHVLK
jgi:hypothetical protein